MTVSPLDRTEQQLVSVDKGPKITNHLKHSANTLTPFGIFPHFLMLQPKQSVYFTETL